MAALKTAICLFRNDLRLHDNECIGIRYDVYFLFLIFFIYFLKLFLFKRYSYLHLITLKIQKVFLRLASIILIGQFLEARWKIIVLTNGTYEIWK